jgi:O-antigen ligase
VSLLASFVVPIVVLWRRCPPRAWAHPDAACAWALATVLLLYALDSLVNAMVNPIYFVIAGAFCGLARSRARAPVPRVAPRTFSPAAAG